MSIYWEAQEGLRCPDFQTASFSGYDFKSQWQKTQTSFLNQDYSLLQNLAYRYIRDVYEKTDFDIENDLLMKMDGFYCMGLGEGGKYSFIMERLSKFNSEDLFKKMKIAFIRFAPFTKPILRDYTLQDGTKAQEWIVDTQTDIETRELSYNGVKIEQTKVDQRQ